VSLAAFAPLEHEAEGVVFIIRGTIMAAPESYIVKDPIKLQVEGDRIMSVEGDTEQAAFFSSWLKSWKDPGSYVISRTGFGLDHRIRAYSAADPVAPESMYGAITSLLAQICLDF
jgi:hypothetical protein